MVSRVYVEKKPGFDVETQQLAHELRDILGIERLEGLRLVNRYDVEGITEELFAQCVPTVFSEPQSDVAALEMPETDGAAVFAVEYLPGQFDQRADSASECIQLISQGERPEVRSAKVYVLEGALTDDDVAAIKHYVINPIEAREASLEPRETLHMEQPVPPMVETVEGFLDLDEAGLAAFIADRGLAMDLADLAFCQRYFVEEGRNPTITEIKMIDTYWSCLLYTSVADEAEDVGVAALGVIDLQAHAFQLAAEFVDLDFGGVLFEYDDHGGFSFSYFRTAGERKPPCRRCFSIMNFTIVK